MDMIKCFYSSQDPFFMDRLLFIGTPIILYIIPFLCYYSFFLIKKNHTTDQIGFVSFICRILKFIFCCIGVEDYSCRFFVIRTHTRVKRWIRFFTGDNDTVINNRGNISFIMISLQRTLFFVIIFMIYIFFEYKNSCGKVFSLDSINMSASISFYQFIFLFVGVFSLSFWDERKKYGDQWKYLAETYNEYLKSEGRKKNILKSALAIDILDTNMWSHKSYKMIFFENLHEAFTFYYNQKNEEINDLFSEIRTHNFTNENKFCLIAKTTKKEFLGFYFDDKSKNNIVDQIVFDKEYIRYIFEIYQIHKESARTPSTHICSSPSH